MNIKPVLRVFVFSLTFLMVLPKAGAQTKDQDSLTTWELMAYDGKSVFGGFKHAYSRPLQWGKDDFLTAGAIVLGTGILYTFDENSSPWFRDQEEHVPGLIKDAGYYFGKPLYNYGLSGGIYALGLFTKNEKIRKTGVLLVSSGVTVGLLQTLSKTIVGRARPIANEGKGSFEPFSKEAVYHSFPSGHTILSFTTAYAIGKQFNDPWVKGGIYALGLVSPVSRLWSGAHWLTDVALSVAMSVVVVDSIDKYLNRERYPNQFSKDKINWSLHMGPGSVGLRGSF
ncbi:phosphatase PAP2 family protein [Arenibacter sp. 6A1]|uniref:phosphatase PAP2 family protein n=1 Tax=Arenibacter sp. 6A1 TaxID=2720391 RepID=UPI0014466484|nr:phosphatase PAP2 family protein [Arenibacter sp. 6A1]NKI25342.1 phosphatase PAP2 family protein [Arenibacter sp. 6A1]